jgi:MSHA biogenesis protein MshK
VYRLKQVINSVVVTTVLSVSTITLAANIDPTRPFDSATKSSTNQPVTSKLVLQSIIHGDGIHTAVINGMVIKPGEHIGQYRLVAINDTSVILGNADERVKLYVFKQKIIK